MFKYKYSYSWSQIIYAFLNILKDAIHITKDKHDYWL